MKCPWCQRENPVGAQFCGQCGAQLEGRCVACQAPNPPANRFCHKCGQPLATAARSASAPTAVVMDGDPSVARSGDGAEARGSGVRRRREADERPDQDREPDDVGSSGSGAKPKRLCIVSRDRLVSGELLQALQLSLDPDDELEIIPDRRRADPSMGAEPDAAEQPSVDRRRDPHLDSRLKKNGFAIVPALAAGPRAQRTPLSLLLPEMPIARVSPEDLEDEERLERVRNFKRERAGRLATLLILAGLTGAVVVLVALSPAVKILVSRVRPEAPLPKSPAPTRQDKESPTVADAPSVTADPAIAPPSGLPEAFSPGRAENPPSDAVRKSPATGVPEPTQSAPARTATGRAEEASASARVAPNPRAPSPSRPIASVPSSPVASASPPDSAATRITAPGFPGLPRVEVVRSAAAVTGQGEAYTVRISDTAGQPLAGAEVFLVISRADGSVLDILLDPGPEPGTYRGTGLPGRSALVDLRVRVITSDKRVEIPLAP